MGLYVPVVKEVERRLGVRKQTCKKGSPEANGDLKEKDDGSEINLLIILLIIIMLMI